MDGGGGGGGGGGVSLRRRGRGGPLDNSPALGVVFTMGGRDIVLVGLEDDKVDDLVVSIACCLADGFVCPSCSGGCCCMAISGGGKGYPNGGGIGIPGGT